MSHIFFQTSDFLMETRDFRSFFEDEPYEDLHESARW